MNAILVVKTIWQLLPWDWKVQMALYAVGEVIHLLRWLQAFFRSEREEMLAVV